MFKPASPPPGRPPVDPDAIRIVVHPQFLPGPSDESASRYVFAYHVLIENVSAVPAQLFWRHWLIHDPVAGDQEVEGDGVVGQSPRIEPGGQHRYQSFCVLRGRAGHMEGFYHFRRDDGSVFRAPIPRFTLAVPTEPPGGYHA